MVTKGTSINSFGRNDKIEKRENNIIRTLSRNRDSKGLTSGSKEAHTMKILYGKKLVHALGSAFLIVISEIGVRIKIRCDVCH